MLAPAGLVVLGGCAVALREGVAPVHAAFGGSMVVGAIVIAVVAALLTGGFVVGLGEPDPAAAPSAAGRRGRSRSTKLTVGH
jgi:hypothetical protein